MAAICKLPWCQPVYDDTHLHRYLSLCRRTWPSVFGSSMWSLSTCKVANVLILAYQCIELSL